jgi:Acetyltransferase (GNAT) domain
MKIQNNPFTSNIFERVWMNHFKPTNSIHSFKFMDGVHFYKTALFPIFFNIGKNLTKGNYYEINDKNDYKNKIFVIYDVPSYFDVKKIPQTIKKLKLHKSIQYPGFLIEIDKYSNMDNYLLSTFGKNSRMKMRKYSKRLDACFDISTKMFHGHIDKNEYEILFEYFMILLKRRYSDKQISYNNMHPVEWEFYKKVAYPLILEGKASLFVIYDNETPIAITYNYHSENIVFDAITVFDIDYNKFNIGYLNNLKLINWCFENNIKYLDFSKGYFDYKKRMCSLEYNFEYQILYDNSSMQGKIMALIIFKFFELKSYLRSKDINTKFHKLAFFFKNKRKQKIKHEITELSKLPNIHYLSDINYKMEKYSFLKKIIYDFLYGLSIHSSEIDIYSVNNQKDTYIISSKILIQKVKFIK